MNIIYGDDDNYLRKKKEGEMCIFKFFCFNYQVHKQVPFSML